VCPVRDLGAFSVVDQSSAGEAGANGTPDPRPTGASATRGAVLACTVDYRKPGSLGTALAAVTQGAPVDFVVSCLASRRGTAQDSEAVDYGANLELLRWAEGHGVRSFTLLSAICVQRPRLAFQNAKARFEAALEASPLPYSIVRPTAFFKSLSGQLARVAAGKPFLVFGDGTLTRCKPIAEGDLARYLRLTLEDPTLRGVLPIGGPGPAITPRDQVALLETIVGHPIRVREVPPGLLAVIAAGLDVIGRVWPGLRDKAEFARIGHYYATESMLVWNPELGRYDAGATPEFGSRTLLESYRAQLRGDEHQDLGDHAVF